MVTLQTSRARSPRTAGWASRTRSRRSSTTGRSGTTGLRGQARVRRVPRRHDDDGRVGKTRGCGRAVWEYDTELNQYGTPMALMLLPVLDRRLHRLDGGPLLRVVGHDAVPLPRQLGAVGRTVSSGAQPALRPARRGQGRAVHAAPRRAVLHGVLAGGREEAARTTGLTEIATSGPWVIFEVADSEIVTPLENEPVVVEGADKDSKSWLNMSGRTSSSTRTHVERRARRERARRNGSGSRSAKRRAGATAPARRGHQHHDRRRPHQLRRRPGRRARAREGLLLPELAGFGCRGPVAGGAQPDGGRPDESSTCRSTTGAHRSTSSRIFLTLLGFAGLVWLTRSAAARRSRLRRTSRERGRPGHDDGWDVDQPSSSDDSWDDWDQLGDRR